MDYKVGDLVKFNTDKPKYSKCNVGLDDIGRVHIVIDKTDYINWTLIIKFGKISLYVDPYDVKHI